MKYPFIAKNFFKASRATILHLIAGFALSLALNPSHAQNTLPPTWSAAWAAPQSDAFLSVSLNNQTLRQVVTLHQQGSAIRVRFSNRFGAGPVTLDDIRVGVSTLDAAVAPGTQQRMRFGGLDRITLAPGASIVSDPVIMTVQSMQRLSISFYSAGNLGWMSRHFAANEYSWRAAGNQANRSDGQGFTPLNNSLASWSLIDEIDVLNDTPRRVLVAFGDSITDGVMFSSKDAIGKDARYPDYLARRFKDANQPVSVVSAAIGGNRLLEAGLLPQYGPVGLKRLQQDVIKVQGATDVIMLIGINDLGMANNPDAGKLIVGLQEAITRFQQAGLRVTVGTLTPSKGSVSGKLLGLVPFSFLHGRDSVESARQVVNQWVRTSGKPDAVVDFDSCLKDPAAPSYLLPAYDSGDHLHPNAFGYEAMANCVDLNLFN